MSLAHANTRRVVGVAAGLVLLAISTGSHAGRLVTSDAGRSYELGRQVGKGGFGRVYRARRVGRARRRAGRATPLGKTRGPEVAIKEYDSLATAIEEHAVLKSVAGTRNVQHLVGTGYDERTHSDFLVTGWVAGRGLDRWARARKRSVEDSVGLVIRASSTVAALHDRGVLHLDLKPQNIMVEERDQARDKVTVIDLGIAQRMDADGGAAATGAGTYEFMPPEQRAKGRVDARADVFALGGTLYKLLTNKNPVPDRSRPTSIAPHLDKIQDAALRGILSKALARDPADRYASPRDLARALRRWRARRGRR